MSDEITIAFVGDISLNNRYGNPDLKDPFTAFRPMLSGADFFVGNLEAPMEGSEGFNTLKTPYLYARERAYRLLHYLPLNLVSTAHNHIYDTFESGYKNTTAFLRSEGISFIGSALHHEAKLFFTNIGTGRFAFLNYCHSDTNFAKPPQTEIKLNVYDRDRIASDIKTARQQADFVVLLLHWGGTTDYGYLPCMEQINDARFFIDNGADCIVGHHAHCIQPMEYYRGKPIFYCLGNFCFDDIISEGEISPLRQSGKSGLLALVQFNPKKKKVSVRVRGVRNDNLNILPHPRATLLLHFLRPLLTLYRISPWFRSAYRFFLHRIEPFMFYLETSKRSVWEVIWSALRKRLYSKHT